MQAISAWAFETARQSHNARSTDTTPRQKSGHYAGARHRPWYLLRSKLRYEGIKAAETFALARKSRWHAAQKASATGTKPSDISPPATYFTAPER